MRILLTGANGYIGKRLLPILVEQGHQVFCVVRDASRLVVPPSLRDRIEILEIDFLEVDPGTHFPEGIDIAYYLIHSMTATRHGFQSLEEKAAQNFIDLSDRAAVKRIIYLTGIVNSEELSEHLKSRLAVERILTSGLSKYTVLRAAIIVGSGSASFEIIRDLVEKLPFMVTPQWLNTKCQPIAIRNVLDLLSTVIHHPETENHIYDIGGPDVLTYKEMLLEFAKVRHLRRWIWTLPVMTPKLSSYWLYFVTSTSYNLAVNLVNSMKVDVVARKNNIFDITGIQPITYSEAVELAFRRIEQNTIISSWKDAYNFKGSLDVESLIEVPSFGIFKDQQERKIPSSDRNRVISNIFSIGGHRGWYYASFLWNIRGLLDKMVGGVGLRRGRTSDVDLHPGDALDFWRVIVANRARGRLLLYAEMKLPGEAWLEITVEETDHGENVVRQTATFRPNGIGGRLYWYLMWPFHLFIFRGMLRNMVNYREDQAS